MAHHKRRRAKNRRGGCLLCKPWKANGHSKQRHDAVRFSDYRRKVGADTAVAELIDVDAPAWADYWEQEEAMAMENEFVCGIWWKRLMPRSRGVGHEYGRLR